MPTYSYKCPTCGTTLDKFQKPSDPAPACPNEAAHGTMEKQLSTPGFQVKGAGGYSGKMVAAK